MSLRPAQRHLIVFAKAPVLGRVKRRLGREVGTVGAWTFYRRTVRAVVGRLSADRRWTTWIAVTPDRLAVEGRWFPDNVPRLPQGEGDLGRRMYRALRTPPPGPVVLVGTDIPDIRPSDIAAAFRALGAADLVFGPAADGGFWLVGARRRPSFPDPFHQVRWSTRQALADTLSGMRPRQRIAFLRVLEDVDDAAALDRARRPGR